MTPPKPPHMQAAKKALFMLADRLDTFSKKAVGHARKAAVVIWQHPQTKEARSVCCDLARDLRKLWDHPKVASFRERIQDWKNQPEHPTVTRLRESLHLPYIMLGAGTIIALAMGMVGTQALARSQQIHVHEISREAGMQIRQIRLQQRSESIDTWRSEQRKVQRALKTLEQSRSSGAAHWTGPNGWS